MKIFKRLFLGKGRLEDKNTHDVSHAEELKTSLSSMELANRIVYARNKLDAKQFDNL